MKKLILAAALLVATVVAFGQVETIYAEEATLQWDAVDGADGYDVARSVHPVADRSVPEEVIGFASGESLTVAVPDDGRSHVYAIRAAGDADSSAWTWSDVEGKPGPFVLRRRLDKPENLTVTSR